ncbi:MAG: indole-3-glycerol phosphate synthase TrpC [Kofleriaceae bacterium]
MSEALPDILTKILARKREEVAAREAATPLVELAARVRDLPPARGLAAALRRAPGAPVNVLAEIKRASPSAGAIRAGADPVEIARAYATHGAAAISVLTDRDFFDGDLAFLSACRAAVAVPLLCKDFILGPYQLAEARAAGADGALLIAAALGERRLAELHAEATRLGLDALVEVHDETEAGWAVAAGATLIGVNHRSLRTFTIDMSLTGAIAPSLPVDAVLVAESGIRRGADVALLGAVGAHAVLVGETLMRAPSPGLALAELRAEARAPS